MNRFKHWLKEKYQLIIRNKAFEEKFSIDLTRSKVIVAAILSAILLIALTTLLIAFTPLREYIPGYGSASQNKKLFTLRVRLDSLAGQMEAYEHYISNFQTILNEDFSNDTAVFMQNGDKKKRHSSNQFAFSKEDSVLMSIPWKKQDESANTVSIRKKRETERRILFQPTAGNAAAQYFPEESRLQVPSDANQPVLATDKGVVISLEKETVCIQHPDNRISIYRQIHHPLVQRGQQVRSGQNVAYTGEKGFVFEYWIDGRPVNPLEYIAFK